MATGAAANAPAPTKQKSKAYLSSVAIQSDAIKYRQKYKELKRKVHEIELVCILHLPLRKMTSFRPRRCGLKETFNVCVWNERMYPMYPISYNTVFSMNASRPICEMPRRPRRVPLIPCAMRKQALKVLSLKSRMCRQSRARRWKMMQLLPSLSKRCNVDCPFFIFITMLVHSFYTNSYRCS